MAGCTMYCGDSETELLTIGSFCTYMCIIRRFQFGGRMDNGNVFKRRQ